MSNFCPPPPDAGIILEVVHFFLRTCFYTILDSSTNFSRKKVTNFAAHHHNVCSCSQKLSAIIIKQRPSRSACSFMQARHVMIMDRNCVETINYIEVHTKNQSTHFVHCNILYTDCQGQSLLIVL